jgi:hypothetical protein
LRDQFSVGSKSMKYDALDGIVNLRILLYGCIVYPISIKTLKTIIITWYTKLHTRKSINYLINNNKIIQNFRNPFELAI